MKFLRRAVPAQWCRFQRRGYVDPSVIKHVRDRGFDHAVERERYLKPVLAIKHLLKSEPSMSLPISAIANEKEALHIPIRPIEFIRKYPTVFEEHLPGGGGVLPHIKLASQAVEIDSDEQLVYQSESYKQDMADRLIKLLMISRVHKLPLHVLTAIQWEMGLPHDYSTNLVSEFPDYFWVIEEESFSSSLELVCWSHRHSISFIEKLSKDAIPGAFPMDFHPNFVMDKRFKVWLEDWQKLNFISPYSNALHLGPNTDESDKWVVGILHELLNLFVSKKVEKETLLDLTDCFGIRSRAKRALMQHPGIFYVSSKAATHTVFLKEAYTRGALVEKNPLMEIRHRYLRLMNNRSGENRKKSEVKAAEVIREKDNSDKVYRNGEEDDDDEDDEDDEDEDDEDEDEEEEQDSASEMDDYRSSSNRRPSSRNFTSKRFRGKSCDENGRKKHNMKSFDNGLQSQKGSSNYQRKNRRSKISLAAL